MAVCRRLVDLGFRIVYRYGFLAARAWWQITRPKHQGALVAIWCDRRLLLLRQSYQHRLTFPGGGVEPGETPADAALRELVEELELEVDRDHLAFACQATDLWDGRRDTVTFFELRVAAEPTLRLDQREIIGAGFVAEGDLPRSMVSGQVAHYLRWRAERDAPAGS